MAFFDPNRVVTEDKRYNYGEDRYQLTGMIHQRLFIVVYTPRPATTPYELFRRLKRIDEK